MNLAQKIVTSTSLISDLASESSAAWTFSPEQIENLTIEDANTNNKFLLPMWRQVFWGALYALMVIVGTGGNLIVIWIVFSHKQMRTVTNYFLLNLSIADAMANTLNVTFNFIYMLNAHWPFGEVYCKITQFVAVLTVCSSVFSLMSIAIDRYMAIMTPLRPRMGHTVTILLATGIWVISIIIGTPNLIVFRALEDNSSRRVVCYPDWPDGVTNDSRLEYIYNILILIFAYMAPIAIMTYCYTCIGIELWGSQSIGECTQRQMENIKSKKKVVKMMIVIVLMFGVCWLPYHLYFLMTAYFPDLTRSPYIHELYLAIYWLAMSNSMVNPIIYCWMNARFRNGFKQFFSLASPAHIQRTFSRHYNASGRRGSMWDTHNSSAKY